MPLTSYAQNFEDVMLMRALGHISQGYYIDVGAAHPTIDSVTRAFYERGWRGVNIEPQADLHAALCNERPHDINLQVAVSDRPGAIELTNAGIPGWTTSDPDRIAEIHSLGHNTERFTVDSARLDAVIKDHLAGLDIHFLKIDVEGSEKSVLASVDLQQVRPWIIVIEAFAPDSDKLVSSAWEELITKHNYSLCYCDGLNNFYVADEHSDLKKYFVYPPNVQDNFEPALADAYRDLQGRVESLAKQTDAIADKLAKQNEVRFGKLEEQTDAISSKLAKQNEVRFGKLEEQTDAISNKLAKQNEVRFGKLEEQTDAISNKLAKQNEVRFGKLEEQTDAISSKLAKQNEVRFGKLEEQTDAISSKLAKQNEVRFGKLEEQTDAISSKLAKQNEVRFGKLEEQTDAISSKLAKQNEVRFGKLEEQTDAISSKLAKQNEVRFGKLEEQTDAISSKLAKQNEACFDSIKNQNDAQFSALHGAIMHLINHPASLPMYRPTTLQQASELIRRRGKIGAKKVLAKTYGVAIKSPRIKALIGRQSPMAPKLLARLTGAGRNQYISDSKQEPSASLVQPLSLRGTGSPVYLYVDHTCGFELNTGVQQVVRGLTSGLIAIGCDVVPVKWNADSLRFQLLTTNDLDTLLLYTELPELSIAQLCERSTGALLDHLPHSSAPGILLLPEVTHLNSQGHDNTQSVVQEAFRLGLRRAALFYDAIPLLRDDLKAMAPIHSSYMKALLEVEYIAPISIFSAKQLIKFRDDQSLPQKALIEPLHLAQSFSLSGLLSRDGLPSGRFALCVGSITFHKNQLALVEAFKVFKTRHPEHTLSLVLVGNFDARFRPAIITAIAERSDIIILESASNDQLRAAYKYCDFTVFPSTMEGFGLPIIESLYFGKPCITANFGAMAEVGTKSGCIQVDIRKVDVIADEIEKLATNQSALKRKTKQAQARNIDNWEDYTQKLLANLVQVFPELQLNSIEKGTKISAVSERPKRIFFLGMHKILVRTELPRLRALGYEVFNPPYLSDVADQSAQMDWDANQVSTLPRDVFDKLSDAQFFYVDEFSNDIVALLNQHFDAVIVTISPTWLAPVLRQFNGKVIYRVYGQTHNLDDEFLRLGLKSYAKDNPNFYFTPHAAEAVEAEPAWMRQNENIVPYCLAEDVFGYANSWVGAKAHSKEVALGCPNISNPFYAEHYAYLKEHFIDPWYKFYGIQLTEVDDPAVMGTLPRHAFLNKFKNSACYLYTYSDSRVCYLPPIEAMVIGLPVIFPKGCLLDKYFGGIETPACWSTEKEAIDLVDRLRGGDAKLASAIIAPQQEVVQRYKPSYVWEVFDEFFNRVI